MGIMANQMEKKMEHEMETGGKQGFKESKLSYQNGYIYIVISRVSPI